MRLPAGRVWHEVTSVDVGRVVDGEDSHVGIGTSALGWLGAVLES